jgi:predicted enzyme related to lactoylglutathione lyase
MRRCRSTAKFWDFRSCAGPDLAFPDADGARLMLTTHRGAVPVGHNLVLYFKVSDIVAAHDAMVDAGSRQRTHPGTRCHVARP